MSCVFCHKEQIATDIVYEDEMVITGNQYSLLAFQYMAYFEKFCFCRESILAGDTFDCDWNYDCGT